MVKYRLKVEYQKWTEYNSISTDMFFVYCTDIKLPPGAVGCYKMAAVLMLMLVSITGMVSCVEKMDYMSKVSGTLLQQVELRREQIVSPNAERLKQMHDMGMSTGDLNKQPVFIYVKEPLSTAQSEDLNSLGVNVRTDSWIPPVGSHPLGFFIAEMPVDKLEAVAARDYIASLDTAERQSLPQCPVTNY
jgi:hypothetical protein